MTVVKYVDINYMVGLTIFACGLLSFVLNWDHLIMSLLSLEAMALSLYFLFGLGSTMGGESFGVLFYICLAVCEGCLGLSVFVNMVSHGGSDKMGVLNYVSWQDFWLWEVQL